jgi:chromosome segregation ATPase
MTDQDEYSIDETSRVGLQPGIVAIITVLALAALGGLVWSYILSQRIAQQEKQAQDLMAENQKLADGLDKTNARLKVESEALGQSVGITQRQFEVRAQSLLQRQQADAKRMEAAAEEARKAIGNVSDEVSSVKTDVGGVKTEVSKTQNDLQSAVTQLQSMRGDMGVQSGLIARNHDELELLKHRGDRSYFEFTLKKNSKQTVSVVSLELKKADPKHNRFTLNVYADDKKIEKKDRTLNEPIQFYAGKTPGLYEIVVNTIDNKNQVVGYVSAPKNTEAQQ